MLSTTPSDSAEQLGARNEFDLTGYGLPPCRRIDAAGSNWDEYIDLHGINISFLTPVPVSQNHRLRDEEIMLTF